MRQSVALREIVIEPSRVMKRKEKSRTNGHARAVLDKAPPKGWDTSDEEEIERRRWRGRTEIAAIEALEADEPVYGTFRARSGTGSAYEVEIRDLEEPANSCGCIDHRVNRLGTCKHIEGVLAALRRRGSRDLKEAQARGNRRIEVFLDRRDALHPTVTWPRFDHAGVRAARQWLGRFLDKSGTLAADADKVQALVRAFHEAPEHVRSALRVSRHFEPWIERLRRERSREAAKAQFLAEVAAGTESFDIVRLPLLPYQRQGMLHLAFGERALLADEMGLGKTVQAIAACELLARRKDIARVLIVCPASLKAEWEEQIARFTERPARSVFGPRAERLHCYRNPLFFTIVNYEQVLPDAEDLNTLLAPDVVVLDEAQRIKNWHTKTARRVKLLRAPHAFVLTGTPLENRIDELYSIVQYLDPELLGPLFRFNRDFYELDERGRPIDYKNLAELSRRAGSVMLRRRKSDVESELPGRSVKTYFVAMAEEQRKHYEDYRVPAARLIAQAQRRALTEAEFKKLQIFLACMRMVCDTPAILDPSCRVSPKLEELEKILTDLFEEPDRKVIVFSEWERMLEMVRELAGEMGIEAAWHTGSVAQKRRRAEINRFKKDPACRLFLSTDSGSVGLNLQVASAVVNVDLPWNPARLEQRIARAWRKFQTRSVTVVNLVCEDSIEHGIMHIIGQKQALADGVLDGRGDLSALKMPSGRGAMIERMQAMLEAAEEAAAPPIVPAEEAIAEDLKQRHNGRALLIEARRTGDGALRMLAVLDLGREAISVEAKRLAPQGADQPAVEVIDRATWLTLQRLKASGLVQFTEGPVRILHRASDLADDPAEHLRMRVAQLSGQAECTLKMARVLATGGFPEEVPQALTKAILYGAAAKLASLGELDEKAEAATSAQIVDLIARGALPADASTTLAALAPSAQALSASEAGRLIEATSSLLAA